MIRTLRPASILLTVLLVVLTPLEAQGPALGEPLTEPQRIHVETDPVTMLYTQFAEVEIPLSPTESRKIWTRAYGLEPTQDMIPAPSFFFHPGDFLQITINNHLDPDDPKLQDFESEIDPVFDTDEIIHHVHGELNIPHNANNTNLHTHGLHVDPSHGDVTLILIPKGDQKTNYDPSLWPYIREQIWPYQYRIPQDHLPGTHWYHAHKHGSTSVHVENGMAGALIIQPEDPKDDVIPGLKSANDRVLILQEIANYGQQQGVGESLTDFDVDSAGAAAVDPDAKPKNPQRAPMITVNGQVQPSLKLAPGQVERWRFINAAANHRSFSYLWLGHQVECPKLEKKAETKAQSYYVEVPMHLVALDGITLEASVPITAERPLFMGPGNRADVAVKLDDTGAYGLFKNFPSDVQVVTSDCKPVQPPAQTDSISNPYLLGQKPNSNPTFADFKQPWVILDTTTGAPKDVQSTSLVPKLAVTPDGSGLLDVTYETQFGVGAVGWQAVASVELGGGATDTQKMIAITVEGDPVTSPGLPSDSHLASISPTGTMTPPAYVSPIESRDILQSRTALFDISGITVVVEPEDQSSEAQRIKQFTLNGRQFDLDDSIGNADAVTLINKPPQVPAMASSGSQDLSLDCVDPNGLWANQHWTNPAYYRPIRQITVQGKQGFTYESDDVARASGSQTCRPEPGEGVELSYFDVTGLEVDGDQNVVSLVHPGFAGSDRIAGIPGLPVATTAEEWVLINNSPVGHPFHIHINPFFITEVGQLSYEGFKGSKACGGDPGSHDAHKAWVIRTIDPSSDGQPTDACSMDAPTEPTKLTGTSTMWWVVNNWWDTIVIPPHGYVKMRYWMNVPQQTASGAQVFDDVNRVGSWVYHCHILRHEDRGMMMVVGTQPKRQK